MYLLFTVSIFLNESMISTKCGNDEADGNSVTLITFVSICSDDFFLLLELHLPVFLLLLQINLPVWFRFIIRRRQFFNLLSYITSIITFIKVLYIATVNCSIILWLVLFYGVICYNNKISTLRTRSSVCHLLILCCVY